MKNIVKIIGMLAVAALLGTTESKAQSQNFTWTNTAVTINATALLEKDGTYNPTNGVYTSKSPVGLKINNKWLIAQLWSAYNSGSAPTNAKLVYNWYSGYFEVHSGAVVVLVDDNQYLSVNSIGNIVYSGVYNENTLSQNETKRVPFQVIYSIDSDNNFTFDGIVTQNEVSSSTNRLGVQSASITQDLNYGSGGGVIAGSNLVINASGSWNISGSDKYNVAP